MATFGAFVFGVLAGIGLVVVFTLAVRGFWDLMVVLNRGNYRSE